MLNNKVAVIYGAGGAISSAVAKAFARKGARLFLTGRTRGRVEGVAKDITVAGGRAEAAEVDALQEQAVDKHLFANGERQIEPRRYFVQRDRISRALLA